MDNDIITSINNRNIATMLRRKEILTAMVLAASIWGIAEAFNCKFPNEGCDDNNECCSGKCVDAHPGTNARCTKLSLHKPCLYTYQCEDRLRCGSGNTCCAKYWGICTEARDCCDPQHKCYEAEGFYYKRCLYSSTLNNGAPLSSSYATLTVTACLLVAMTTWWR